MPPSIPAPTPTPTPEALTLAANIFHADIDAWLPSNFGVTRSNAAKDAEWAAARSYGGSDRLGVGHPDAADPEARRRAQSSRAGGDLLRKVVRKKRRGDEEEASAASFGGAVGGRGGGDDDDESRTRAVSSKKRRKADAFAKSAKVTAVHPLLNLKNPIPGYDAPAALPLAAKAKAQPKVVDESVNAAAALAASLRTGPSPRMTISAPAKATLAVGSSESTQVNGGSDDEGCQDGRQDGQGANGTMSKAALRREKRKRAKLVKKAA